MKGFNGTISSNSPPDPALLNIISATLGFKALCARLPSVLQPRDDEVLARLDNVWQERGGVALFDRAVGCFSSLLGAQVQGLQQHKVINSDNAQRLTAWLSDTSGTDVHGITLTDGDGQASTLHTAYVFGTLQQAPAESAPYAPEYFVWLWTPGNGIEQFPTLGWMTDRLLRRAAAKKGPALLAYPPLGDELDPHTCTLSFKPVQVPLAEHIVAEVVSCQRSLLRDALAAEDQPQVDQVVGLSTLNKGLDAHLGELLRAYHVRTLPAWLRHATEDQREAYRDGEAALSAAQQAYDSEFKPFSTHQAYARQQIMDFLAAELAIDLDPESVSVDTRFQLASKGINETVLERTTLVAFGLQELTAQHLQVTVDDALQAQGVTPDLLWRMHAQLDLRVRYYAALKQHYNQPATQQRLADVLSLRLALTLRAARYQDHADHDLISAVENVRAAPTKPFEPGMQVGQVLATARKIPLRDLLVFGIGEGAAQRLMLYAPGSPAGRDILVFDSQRQLNVEVSGWVLTEAGRYYLTAQVPVASRARTRRSLERAARRPGGKVLTSLVVQWRENASFCDAMLLFARNKAAIHVDEFSDLTPAWYRKADADTRVGMAHLDKRLSHMRKAFARSSSYTPFTDFARQDVQARLDSLVERHQPSQRHDCDKLIIHYEPHGDISLLRAAMDDLRFDTPFVLGSLSSAVGYSVQGLPFAGVLAIAEEARLAQRYMANIQQRFLDSSEPGYERRLDLFFDISQAEMKRACISQGAAGQITAQQAAWLGTMIDELDDLEPPIVGGDRTFEKTGIYRLGVDGRCVHGAYIFRHRSDDGSQQDLLYTPQAPDGLWFRPLNGLRDALEQGSFEDYLYNRVRYKDQRVIGSLLERWKGSQYPAHLIDPAIAPHSRVALWRDEFVERMQGVVLDVDESTVTAAERVSEIFESLILNVLTIAVAPFAPAAMALNIFLTARSLIRGVQSYQDGDRAAAFWHFIDVVHGVTSITTARDVLKETVAKALFKGFAPAAVVRLIDEMDIVLTTELTNFLKTQISENDE